MTGRQPGAAGEGALFSDDSACRKANEGQAGAYSEREPEDGVGVKAVVAFRRSCAAACSSRPLAVARPDPVPGRG
jgi:hypothetical protein